MAWLAALAVALLLVGGGAYLYLFVVAPTPRAHRHIPAGTTLAARADAVKLLTFEPVRKHLWPLLLDEEVEPDPATSRRLRRIAEETGVRIPTDLRELVVASMDGTSWVALAGGTIEPGRFVSGLARVFEQEGSEGWRSERELLVHGAGVAIGQADDGTLVFGTNAEMARAALPEREDGDAIDLATDEAVTFALESRGYRGLLSELPDTIPGLDTLSRVERVTGRFALGREPRLVLGVSPTAGVDVATLASDLSSMLSKLKLFSLLLKDDPFGAKQALGSAQASADGAVVRVEALWPYDALDRGAKEAADWIRRGRVKTPPLPAPH